MARTVHSLGDQEMDARKEAHQLLLEWGVDWPERIEPVLKLPSSDPEIQAGKSFLLAEIDRCRLRRSWEDLFERTAFEADPDPRRRKSRIQEVERMRAMVRDLMEMPSPEKLYDFGDFGAGREWCRDEAASLVLRFRLHPDPRMREVVAWSLRRFPRNRASAEAADLLRDRSADVRRLAIDSLGHLGDFSHAGLVNDLLEDDHVGVRCDATRYLERSGERRFIPSISALLADPDEEVRASAVSSLAHFGDRVSLPAIAALLEDEKVRVRSAAAQSMAKLSGQGWKGNEDGVQAARKWWARHKADLEYGSGR